MIVTSIQPHRTSVHGAAALRRRGFSFTEVLFAIMILGVGFIMIAGVFPVSLSQVKLTNEESTAAAVARNAINFLQRQAELPHHDALFRPTVGAAPNFPAPPPGRKQVYTAIGQVWSLYDTRMDAQDPQQRELLWSTVAGNIISPTDPRYAWVAVYRRDVNYIVATDIRGTQLPTQVVPSPYAQVTVIPVVARNRPMFTRGDDIDATVGGSVKNLAARLLPRARFTYNAGTRSSQVIFNTTNLEYVAEGAYVIVSNDLANSGWMNSRVYKVGTRDSTVASGTTYDLVPGNDFQPEYYQDASGNTQTISTLNNTDVLLVGKGLEGSTPEGAAMDVSVYTTYIKIN